MTTVVETRACTCCGVDPLAVACEALVVRALEVLGKRIVRSDRSRWVERGDTPWHEVHGRWTPDRRDVDAALDTAWDRLPGLCHRWGHPDIDGLTGRLDGYTRALIDAGEPPTIDDIVQVVRR